MFYSKLKLKVNAAVSVFFVLLLVIIIVGCGNKKTPPEVFPSEEERLTATTIYSNKDSVYSPSNESITYDKDENLFYYDNMIIVYLLSEFSDMQANELAISVDGIVVGKIKGCLNALQIMVEPNNLSGLETLANKVMENENVLYASYDFPRPLSVSATDNNPWDDSGKVISDKNNEDNPDGNDWWAEAIGSYTAWKLVDTHGSDLTNTRVGIIDNGFDIDHEDLVGKITFLSDYPANTDEDGHGTAVAALISANNNTVGLRGVSDTSKLICVDWSPVTNNDKSEEYVSLLSTGEYLEVIKSMLEHDVKVINCSWGIHFMSEDAFAKDFRDNVVFGWLMNRVKEKWTYKAYCAYIQTFAQRTGMECFALFTGLICGGVEDFLVVQAAGNGFDNGEMDTGYDAKYEGFFCSMTEETYNLFSLETRERMTKLGCSYDSLREHTIIVGAVKNSKDKDGNYQMCGFSNFGTMVDICAPGYAVFTATIDNGYQWGEKSCGTSYAAPMVSGAAALVWSFSPDSPAAEIKRILRNNTQNKAVGVGNDSGRLYPMLNVGAAVQAVVSDYEDLVTDAYYETYEDEYGSYEWCVPKINLKSNDVDTINSVIWENVYTDCVEMNHETINQDATFVVFDVIDYDWAVNRDILSLRIHTGSFSWDYYQVYNINISTGKEITRNELIQIYGLTMNEYSELAEQALGSAFWGNWNREDENFKQAYFVDWFNRALENTISKTNVNESIPYINEDGQLCMIAKIYSLAGADYYFHNLNLDNFMLVEDYAQLAEYQVQLVGVLNHILGDWTDGSEEYRIFADERFERNIIYITNGEVMFRTNIESGAVEVTGESTANLIPYVQPGTLQSWMELKYDPTTETIYVGNSTHPYYRMSNWISGNMPDVKYTDPDDRTSGICGDDISWRLVDGELTIGGTGPMTNYTTNLFTPAPWYSMNNSKIKSVNIVNGVTRIGNCAFDDCKRLTSVYIPASVTSIGDHVFDGCSSLSDIYYAGQEAQWIGIKIDDDDFLDFVTVHYGVSKENNVDLPDVPKEKKYGDNITWIITDGVLCASGVGKMENYSSTAYVPWYEERAKVTAVIMEGTITSVGSYAFGGFGKMTSIILPDTIRRIEEFAFWRCDDLPNITIPNGCSVIGNSAFNWCESLEVITLPATITEIQWNAFAHCENLSDIYFAGTMEQWQSINISRTGNEELLSATIHYNSSGPSN